MNAQDRFCPKCGTDVTAPPPRLSGSAQGTVLREVEVKAVGGETSGRAPLLAGGRRYASLTRTAERMIRSAGILRPASLVTAVMGGLAVALWLHETPLIAILVGGVVGVGIVVAGWVLYLLQTLIGELMYVVMDIEESLRRRD